ncbi:MAG: tRNA-dihydrouridine synthase family protein [Crocinitomicaceae bacterium]|nr:tRNA-dihydrouridine synthase family protein [Crocinitomicaceae bacterium]
MRDFLNLAPLQSFTDHHFRNAFQEFMGDVDQFYAPYLKMNNDGTIKEGPKKDILPKNNPFEPVIPQLMACCPADFFIMADYIADLGYTEVNWNLGCPYPMVAKRDLGSGILNKPEKITHILDEVLPKTKLQVGIKMRMGYEDTNDILKILPELNAYPLTEIIVHARYGKQLYQGECDRHQFTNCIPLTNHRLTYNGDIRSVAEFRTLKTMFPEVNHWMIGREAIGNPFLFEMIQEDSEELPEDWRSVFESFLVQLLENHLSESDNQGNIFLKTKHYWEYFHAGVLKETGDYRRFKKLKNLDDYRTFLSDFV